MSENKVSIHLQGGAGNLLFQVATTLAYAKETGREAIFPLQTDQGCSRTKSYTDTVLRNIKRESPVPTDRWAIFRENGYPYQPIPKNVSPSVNIMLDGYFQSWKYFENYKKELKEIFAPRSEDLKYINEKYPLLSKDLDTLSIHIRRGDYTALPDIHFNQPMSYYENAFEKFKGSKPFDPKNLCIFIFSDDLEWCKKQKFFMELDKIHFVYFVDEEDYISLYMMEMCKNHIIANSSFSWMGAYFSDASGYVIAPKTWFGHRGPAFRMEDIAPKGWIVI